MQSISGRTAKMALGFSCKCGSQKKGDPKDIQFDLVHDNGGISCLNAATAGVS